MKGFANMVSISKMVSIGEEEVQTVGVKVFFGRRLQGRSFSDYG